MLKTPQSNIVDLFQIELYMGIFLSMTLACEHEQWTQACEHGGIFL